ncbi:MAG: TIGR03087 family PEP-CTERM/XrtA system glycosyltransferase [Chromatiaceae bacterium]|nr:TIGR03087 family PEP-CTERM/XrtA system glycosyltransferase [Chromatiaceae bacterium]
MDDLLYLVHRIPWPPEKGDKIRSYHLLEALSERYRVHLAAFIDRPEDERHREAARARCASAWFGRLDPRLAKVRALGALASAAPLSLAYYRSPALARWLARLRTRHDIHRALVFSSVMGQYVLGPQWSGVRRVVDLVDVDSEKWRQYAAARRGVLGWPMRWIETREAERLAAFERRLALECEATVLVSAPELALFQARSGLDGGRLWAIPNGVDLERFAPDPSRPSPYPGAAPRAVFTGAMDYWANVEGVEWFARDILPQVRARVPALEFYIVGMNPAPSVQRLARLPGVFVTGRVPDTRPYLQHASLVVAPLRIARGIQNKVLEAMAMARPVVTTPAALEGIGARPGRDLRLGENAAGFAAEVLAILEQGGEALGESARAFVRSGFAWRASQARFIHLIEGA